MQIHDVFFFLWDHPDDLCYLTRHQHITFGDNRFISHKPSLLAIVFPSQ